MKIAKFLLWSFLILSFRAEAQVTVDALEESVFNSLRAECMSDQQALQHGLRFVQSMKYSLSAMSDLALNLKLDPAIQVMKDRGLTPTTSFVLNSAALPRALAACYPDSEEKRNQFVMKMIVADTLGRGVGTIQGYLAFRFTGAAFAVALRKSFQILRWTPFGRNIPAQMEGKYVRIVGAHLIGASAVSQAVTLYKQRKLVRAQDEDDLAQQVEILALAEREWKRAEQSENRSCENTKDQFEVAQIAIDTFKTLQSMNAPKEVLAKYTALYGASLQAVLCQTPSVLK